MRVELAVGIYIVQAQSVWVLVVDGYLMGASPVVDVLFRKRVGLLQQLSRYLQSLLARSPLGEGQYLSARRSAQPVAYACNDV